MTGLREALAGYLDLRRGLGFKLERDAKLLDQPDQGLDGELLAEAARRLGTAPGQSR